MSPKNLIAVVGPTAIGKTSLAIALAKQFKTEIISADSRQFFKEMSIGTAVPSLEELQTVPHHFIQHLSVHESFSVGDFEKVALEKLDDLFKLHDVTILVGGSGLYVDAVVRGIDTFPDIDHSIREELNETLTISGLEPLQQELLEKDPEYHARVDLNNPHRVIRALEVCRGTKRPYSSFLGIQKANRTFNTLYVGLTAPREVIYQRIEQRVDLMMQEGVLEEAKSLYPLRQLNALQTVGYRELFSHFDGTLNLDEAIAEIKKNTRRFAKRQLTWLRKNEEIIWVNHDESFNSILSKVESKLQL
ncbi:MAG: tRNA (adenosine(37)-N6)-dimethylallyltransferase MiaA [Bacteroidota bacterium]